MKEISVRSAPTASECGTYLLLRHLLGESDDHAVSLDGSGQGQANTWSERRRARSKVHFPTVVLAILDARAVLEMRMGREKGKRDVPVLPEVGSMRTSPGLMRPCFSASSTILLPMRSLTEPPELKNSHLATVYTRALAQISDLGWSRVWGRARTKLALQTLRGSNLVDPDHRSVANIVQNRI